MRVLVVEDDRALGQFLQKGLQREGHEVDWVGDGEAALEHATARRPELLVLEMNLGVDGQGGMEVLCAVHEQYVETAVLVLTGDSGVEQRVACLNAGADDCLVKPFSFHELTARCRAILRRREKYALPVLEYGGVAMHLLERRVRFMGVEVELTAKEFLVLEVLLRRRGECCSREELLRAVWPETPESGTNIVDVYVSYLRRKFSEALAKLESAVHRQMEAVIETVRGAGYRVRELRKLPGSASASSGAGEELAYGD